MITQEMLDLLKEKGLYDLIANYYWKMDKDVLVLLFKEFIYAVYSIDRSHEIDAKATEIMLETLRADSPEIFEGYEEA